MRALGTAAIGTLAAVVGLLDHPADRLPHEDVGIWVYAAERWLAGGLPYVSVWDHKPPGLYAFVGFGLLVGNGSVEGVWAVATIGLIAAAVLGYIAMDRAFGVQAALFGSAAWLLAAPGLFVAPGRSTLFAEFAALPLQFAAMALITVRRSATRDVALGVMGGCAVLLKPTVIGIWLAIALTTFTSSRTRSDVATLARIAVAGAVPVALAGMYFAARGGLVDLWDQVVTYNGAYARAGTLSDHLFAAIHGFELLAPTALSLVVLSGWAAALRTVRRGAPLLLQVAVVALPIEVALIAATSWAYPYYYLTWLPSAAILSAFAASEAQRVLGVRWVGPVAVALLLFMSIVPIVIAGRAPATDQLGRMRPVFELIRSRTTDTDGVFIWGSDAEALFLTRRVSPTRFVYQYAPLFTAGYGDGARARELLGDLQRDPPLLIIDTSPTSSNVTPPLEVGAVARWTTPDPRYVPPPEIDLIAQFVHERYVRLSAPVGQTWSAYVRRDRAAGPIRPETTP